MRHSTSMHLRSSLFVIVTLGVCRVQAADLDHSAWDALLREFVSPDARVDYGALKKDHLVSLDSYLNALAAPWPVGMTPMARKAALINTYNALTVRWILSNYPVDSIWRTDDPFQRARHRINGATVSLDTVESELREMGDPRIHAVLVCAARSCPPLRREAYRAEILEGQLADNSRQWLANPLLNEFFADRRLARVSPILDWYGGDFAATGGIRSFLAKYGPEGKATFLSAGQATIEFQDYHWGLNDSSGRGSDYKTATFYWDMARNGYLWPRVKTWFFGLGEQYGVNPLLFGAIYVGAIPFFSLSIAWLIRNLRAGKSALTPLLCASFCFVSAYLYLLMAGKNIPLWVYVFLAAMVGVGLFSTVRKVQSRLLDKGGK